MRVNFGGHLPQVDLVVGRTHFEDEDTTFFDAVPGFPDGGSLSRFQETDTDKSVSLQVTVPIWASGGTQSRVRQSSYRWQAAKQRLERVMVNAFKEVTALAEAQSVRLREAAYIVALQRVIEAMQIRGIYP